MRITAKLNKLSCFVNNVLQPCLFLDKILILCRLRPFIDSAQITCRCKGAYDLLALSHFNAVI